MEPPVFPFIATAPCVIIGCHLNRRYSIAQCVQRPDAAKESPNFTYGLKKGQSALGLCQAWGWLPTHLPRETDYGSAHPSPRDPAALLLSGQKWANHPCSVKDTLVTGLCGWKFIAETAKKTQTPLRSTLPGRKDNHTLLKLRFLLALLTGYITLTQSFRLTQGARNIPSAWKRKLIQHAHEKGVVVSKRPNIMRTIMPLGVQKKARSSKFLD